jgi:GNAT superfamily N-acetyltransferase
VEKLLEMPSKPGLVSAAEDNGCALWSLYARMPGAEIHDGPNGLLVITNERIPDMNTIHRARFAPAEVDTAIEAAVARARARGVHLMWYVGPSTRPAGIEATLRAHGFVYHQDLVGMAMDLAQLPDRAPMPPGLEISEVTGEQDLRTWCRTMVLAFSMPESSAGAYVRWLRALRSEDRSAVQLFLGRLDGVAVATHLLILGAGVAGVHFLGTLPAARGKGVGSAICHNTLRAGRDRGYRVGVTEAEPMAVGTCHRQGLQDCYTASTYIWWCKRTVKRTLSTAVFRVTGRR